MKKKTMRTVKDFVKQMLQEGRSPEHIRAVTNNSKFKNQIDEIERWLGKGKKIQRKRLKRLKIRRKTY